MDSVGEKIGKMFCDKCGIQLADTASFCNKCGNAIKKKVVQTEADYIAPKKDNRMMKKKVEVLGIIIAFLLIVVIGVVASFLIKSRPTIYGTWTDSSRTITFSFSENKELRVSGPYNILGAELFTFEEDDGKIRLKAKNEVAGMISVEMDYELEGDTMVVSVMGYTMSLYRVDESDASGNIIEDIVDDAIDEMQRESLYGTWSDSTGTISFTFYENGKMRISGLGTTLGVDVFTFSEVDGDTLQLKADSNNALLEVVSVQLDYDIAGDTMTINIADMQYTLVKEK